MATQLLKNQVVLTTQHLDPLTLYLNRFLAQKQEINLGINLLDFTKFSTLRLIRF